MNGVSDWISGLGKTASDLITAVKTPSADDLVKASNANNAARTAFNWKPWAIGGGVLVAGVLLLMLVFSGRRSS